jgi:hypothetical protein
MERLGVKMQQFRPQFFSLALAVVVVVGSVCKAVLVLSSNRPHSCAAGLIVSSCALKNGCMLSP